MNNTISKFTRSKLGNFSLLTIAIATLLIPIIGSMLRSGIDCDSAYYICISQRIAEGYVPYKTLNLGYTPLFIYIMSGFKILFGIPNGCYWPYLLLHYMLELGVAFFVYAIAREFGSIKKVALFSAWLTMMMIHWLQGNCVLLEVPSLFFGLASSFSTIKLKEKNCWNYLWIGCLTTCSFLCKQFGLGFCVLNLYLILAVNRQSWKNCFIFLLGYIMPIVLCFAYWQSDFIPIIFSGYGTKSAIEAGRDVSFYNKFDSVVSGLFYFCYMVCIAIFAGLLDFAKATKCGHFWKLLFGYCGIVGFSLQFIFAGGHHYMIYMVPFACLVLSEMMTIKNVKWIQLIKYISIIMVLIVTFYKVYHNKVYKLYIKSNQRTEQYAFTQKVKQYVKPGEILWVAHGGLYYLYFTADVLPPNISTIGYSFGPLGINEENAFKQAENANWVIRYSRDYEYESFFTDSLKSFVEQFPVVSQFGDSTVLLHKNPKPPQR